MYNLSVNMKSRRLLKYKYMYVFEKETGKQFALEQVRLIMLAIHLLAVAR